MTDQPINVLWLMCDQLRWHALDCHGDPNLVGRTPNIDRLAREGADFSYAYSNAPICTPFRASLVTGQYNHINGVRVHGDMLPTDRRCIGHMFNDAGYRTSWTGKWHLASQLSPMGTSAGADFWVHPMLRGGFQDWFGFDCSNHYYRTRYTTGQRNKALDVPGFQTDGLTDISLDYLDSTARRLDEPWFHCLSVEAPHPGKDANDQGYDHPAPPEYEAMFKPGDISLRENVPAEKHDEARRKLAGYYAQIANLDHNIGRVLRWLDDRNLAERTLVVFFSDHGEFAWSHNRIEKNDPWDESARIPMIFRLPGVIPQNHSPAGVASGIDLLPTTASLAGIPIEPAVQGVDLSSVITGEPQPARDAALLQWLGMARYGFGDYQYRAVCTGRYTYGVSTNRWAILYDNQADPYQLHNRFNDPAFSDIQRQLHRRLRRHILQSGETLPDFIVNADPAD